jgi:hypothetical protein
LSDVGDPVAVTLPGMNVSLVYLLLRQVLQMLTLCRAKTGRTVCELVFCRGRP